MCGRYSLATPDPSALRQRFPLGERVEVRQRFNVAPGDAVLALTTDRDGAPRGDVLRWGLVPHWSKGPGSPGLNLINARAESVAQKPAFRDAFASHRCLVLADGFYEWERREGAPKQPWWITRTDGRPFAFAGLWASWRAAPDVEPVRSCAIVTTCASAELASIHERMPVMLSAEAEATWLEPGARADRLLELCVPLQQTERRAVGPAVNDARYDGPDCLVAAAPVAAQPSLF